MALTLLMESLDKALLERAPKFRAELQAKVQSLAYLRELEEPKAEAEGTAVGRAKASKAGPAVSPEGSGDEQRGAKRPRNRPGPSGGEPAGRMLKPKSRLNYRFSDDDISPSGSWAKRAEWNVDAVELVKRMNAEGRQALETCPLRLTRPTVPICGGNCGGIGGTCRPQSQTG